jgi:hypothetical protein
MGRRAPAESAVGAEVDDGTSTPNNGPPAASPGTERHVRRSSSRRSIGVGIGVASCMCSQVGSTLVEGGFALPKSAAGARLPVTFLMGHRTNRCLAESTE